jgi:hypothetical protein
MPRNPAQKRFETAQDFAMHVINDPDAPGEMKVRLARALLRVQEPRIKPARPPGKKERAQEAAETVGGPFATPPLPRKPN